MEIDSHGPCPDVPGGPVISPPNAAFLDYSRLVRAVQAGELGIWELDPRTGVLTTSAQCKANHGLAPDANLSLDDVLAAVDPDYRDRFRSVVVHAIDSGGSFRIQVPHRWPDGTRHWLEVRGGMVERLLAGISLDITSLCQAQEAALAADRRRDEFVAVLGHELRGPLQALNTAVRMLQLKLSDSPELLRLGDTLVRQTAQLTRLADDLLDVGRMTSGRLAVKREMVSLEALLQQAAEICGPLIAARRHTLIVVPPDRPVRVDVDAGRILQVVCNLLDNAAKYMREGGRIELAASVADGDMVISVRDDGVGLSPDMQDQIFEPFAQVESSRHRAKGGLGIGLSVVKAIVEAHGGRVSVRSEGIGKGSEFVVRLPESAAPGSTVEG